MPTVWQVITIKKLCIPYWAHVQTLISSVIENCLCFVTLSFDEVIYIQSVIGLSDKYHIFQWTRHTPNLFVKKIQFFYTDLYPKSRSFIWYGSTVLY